MFTYIEEHYVYYIRMHCMCTTMYTCVYLSMVDWQSSGARYRVVPTIPVVGSTSPAPACSIDELWATNILLCWREREREGGRVRGRGRERESEREREREREGGREREREREGEGEGGREGESTNFILKSEVHTKDCVQSVFTFPICLYEVARPKSPIFM